jgi:Ser/Thr protein kinase RdoA (MazF antagonist)
MAYKSIGLGTIFAPYRPNGNFNVPFRKTTLAELVEVCLFIDGKHKPEDPEATEELIKGYEGFKPFIEQQMMRDLVYQIRIWESKVFELQLEKTGINPSHKDWSLLMKSISDTKAAYHSEYETYQAMLKLNGIDYDYFKFKLQY